MDDLYFKNLNAANNKGTSDISTPMKDIMLIFLSMKLALPIYTENPAIHTSHGSKNTIRFEAIIIEKCITWKFLCLWKSRGANKLHDIKNITAHIILNPIPPNIVVCLSR